MDQGLKRTLKIGQQARGNAPRSKAARRGGEYGADRTVSGAGGSRRFAEEPGERGEVGPDIGEEDDGPGAEHAIDGKTFQSPALEGGVAGAVIEQFPGRRVEGDVADEAAGAIVLERETHVEDLSVVTVGVEKGHSEIGVGRPVMTHSFLDEQRT